MIKTIIWSVLLTFGVCLTAQGETLEATKGDRSGCNTECSNLDTITIQNATDFPLAQGRYRERTRSGDELKKIYLGGTVGFFLPSDIDEVQFENDDFDVDEIDSDNGFGGSLYAGYKFNSFLSADLELLGLTGNAEPFDSDYGAAAVFLNPRYTLPIGGNPNASLYVFASPGIGLAGVGFGDDLDDQIDEDNLNTGVAIQLKAGAGLPLSESIDVFGQARYFNAFNVYEFDRADGDEESSGFSSFSLEAGLNFKL